jgi:hypothetical protein
MLTMKKTYLTIMLATVWIGISEFLRNEFLFKSLWDAHYRQLGLEFKTLPINGILWLIWSFLLALIINEILKKFSTLKTFFLTWIMAFLMMWLTVYNLQVLPPQLLLFAIPLSSLEIAVAVLIIKKFSIFKSGRNSRH